MNTNIKDSIKRFRKFKGITQKELEEKLGMTDKEIHKIENGKLNPTLAQVRVIAKALGTDYNTLKNS
jgi:transcriptional regulator with XRE-family HTH domain